MMTYTRKTYRLGMTAIAAVLALSSTPLLAQASSTEQPVAETPAPAPAPAPEATAPAPAADPLAPAAEPDATSTATETSAAPAATKAAPKPAAKKSAVKTTRTSESAAAPVAPAPKPAVDPAESSDSSPLVAMKPTEVASVPDAKPAEKSKLNEAVPLAGGAGAVALALAGAGMAIRRRKRHDEEEVYEQEMDETAVADEPQPEPEPRWDPPVVEPVAAAANIAPSQCNDLPENFDTSKFGRHVQAAYCGPTPENPSLSLRRRLKIAAELDRRERESGQSLDAATPEPAATKPVTANPKAPERMAFSFAGTPVEQKWPEKQF